MPLDLRSLVDPASTAAITVECQKGVIGSAGPLSALSQAVRESGIVPRVAAVLRAARAARVPVLHGTVVRRADGGGSTVNCRLFAATRKAGGPGLLAGSTAAQVVDELEVADSDYLVPRYHGVSVFHDTEMDSILRSLAIRTVVLLGVSVNIALLGTTIEAVNRGYQVVMPEDAVTGTPPEYVKMVLANSLGLLATVTRSEEIVAAWRAAR